MNSVRPCVFHFCEVKVRIAEKRHHQKQTIKVAYIVFGIFNLKILSRYRYHVSTNSVRQCVFHYCEEKARLSEKMHQKQTIRLPIVTISIHMHITPAESADLTSNSKPRQPNAPPHVHIPLIYKLSVTKACALFPTDDINDYQCSHAKSSPGHQCDNIEIFLWHEGKDWCTMLTSSDGWLWWLCCR